MNAIEVGQRWFLDHVRVLPLWCLGLTYAIGLGTRAIAGTEEEGSLELVVAHAVSRSGILTARAVVLTLLVSIAAAVTGIAVVVVSWIASIDIVPANVVAVTCAFGLLALLHGYIALAVGAATGRRSWALTAAVVVAVFGYLANHIGSYLADWVPKLSPFHWAYHNKPLEHGFEVGGLGLLVGGIVIALLVAFLGFNRRDLQT